MFLRWGIINLQHNLACFCFFKIVSLYFREQELFFYDLWWGSHSCQSIEIIYKGFTQKVFEFDEDTFSSWLPKKPIIAFPMWSMRMWGLDYTFYCSLRGNTHSFAWKSEQLRANTFTNGKKRLFECNFWQNWCSVDNHYLHVEYKKHWNNLYECINDCLVHTNAVQECYWIANSVIKTLMNGLCTKLFVYCLYWISRWCKWLEC